jgi:rhodanese-related sulfurtransferase
VATARALDRIELGLATSPGGWIYGAISIAINGRGLRDVIDQVEASQRSLPGWDGRGSRYDHLPLGELRASVRDHFLGEPGHKHGVTEGKSMLLICTCGEYGCGAIAVRIQVEARSVVWRDMECVNRRWSYAALSDARFDRRHYEHAISRLEREIDEAAARVGFGAAPPPG